MNDRIVEKLGAALTEAGRRAGWYSGHVYYYHTNDPDAILSYAHYSDPHFDGPGAIIFGAEEDGLEWAYADRLAQWAPEQAEAAHQAMREKYGDKRCARRTEEYLSLYFERPVRLICIRAGTRSDNGYSWHAYGYRFEEAAS